MTLLRSVEKRYNDSRTMQASFEQTLKGQGRISRTERGDLYLQRPGKMRWNYASPEGKLFLVDGKNVYYYNPVNRKAEKTPAKESGDMRTPLAFLMGRLDFQRDFQQFRSRKVGEITQVVASPRSNKAPYTEVEFSLTGGAVIQSVTVTNQDGTVMGFRFSGEKLNPRLSEDVFRFTLPAGAEMVEGEDR